MTDRKPPTRPEPPSDPSIRAAGLSRPRQSNADLANEELKKQNVWQAEQANINRGIIRHNEQVTEHLRAQDAGMVTLARALGVEDKLPPQIRRSTPPPRMTGAPPKPKLDTIERDASRGTAATYATLATTIALIILEVLRLIGSHQ